MTLPQGLLRTIVALTDDPAERERLIRKWARVVREMDERAARIRESARTAPCSCFRPGNRLSDGRCGRCYGVHPGDRS